MDVLCACPGPGVCVAKKKNSTEQNVLTGLEIVLHEILGGLRRHDGDPVRLQQDPCEALLRLSGIAANVLALDVHHCFVGDLTVAQLADLAWQRAGAGRHTRLALSVSAPHGDD